MKPSRYNHFVPVDGKLYAFNCLTERFFPVPDGREETYRTLLDNPDINAEAFARNCNDCGCWFPANMVNCGNC